MISLKIDVSKIDKERLFQGKKGLYLDAVMIETPNSEYGDFMIVEDISYEERQAGQKGTILGNGKIIIKKDQSPPNDSGPQDQADGSNKTFKGDPTGLGF